MTELPSSISWCLNLTENVQTPAGVYGVDVLLAERGQGRRLCGYVVSDDLAPGVTRRIDRNDFLLDAQEAHALLGHLFDSFRSQLAQMGGGMTVYMDREMWRAWLDHEYPGQGAEIEAYLLVPLPKIP